jgi:hypothetical protein
MARNNELFPQPLAPTISTPWPGLIVSERSLISVRAWLGVSTVRFSMARREFCTKAMPSSAFGGASSFRGDESGEAMQAIDPCGKLAEGFEVIDNHRQRAEYRRKSAGRLDRPANFQFPRYHPPGNDRHWAG